jgi:hypothetical protein
MLLVTERLRDRVSGPTEPAQSPNLEEGGDAAPADPPIACTLAADAVGDRVREWRDVLDRARSRTVASDGAVRIEFGGDVDLAALATLVQAEQSCCRFFSFVLEVGPGGVGLEVRAPAGADSLVDALFGRPTE